MANYKIKKSDITKIRKWNFFFNFLKIQGICDSLVLFMSRKNDHVTQKSTFKNRKLRSLIRVKNFSTETFSNFFWLKLNFRFVSGSCFKKISNIISKCDRNRGSKIGCFQKKIFHFLISGTLPMAYNGLPWPILTSHYLLWPHKESIEGIDVRRQ